MGSCHEDLAGAQPAFFGGFSMDEQLRKQVVDRKMAVALSYIPVIMRQLDGDAVSMFAAVLQAMRDGGYDDGFRDGKRAG